MKDSLWVFGGLGLEARRAGNSARLPPELSSPAGCGPALGARAGGSPKDRPLRRGQALGTLHPYEFQSEPLKSSEGGAGWGWVNETDRGWAIITLDACFSALTAAILKGPRRVPLCIQSPREKREEMASFFTGVSSGTSSPHLAGALETMRSRDTAPAVLGGAGGGPPGS